MPKNISYLADLYTPSISNGAFHEKFKLANVAPLFKSGTRLNPSNYGSLTFLSHFSKIFEKFYTLTQIDFFINTMQSVLNNMVFVVVIPLTCIAKIVSSSSYSK